MSKYLKIIFTLNTHYLDQGWGTYLGLQATWISQNFEWATKYYFQIMTNQNAQFYWEVPQNSRVPWVLMVLWRFCNGPSYLEEQISCFSILTRNSEFFASSCRILRVGLLKQVLVLFVVSFIVHCHKEYFWISLHKEGTATAKDSLKLLG